MTAFFAFKDRAADYAILDDWCRAPSVKQQTHFGLVYHAHGQRLERLGIDGGRPSDDAVVSGGPLPRSAAVAASRCPHSARGGPWIASFGSLPTNSSARPRMTFRPDQSVMRSIQMTRPPVENPSDYSVQPAIHQRQAAPRRWRRPFRQARHRRPARRFQRRLVFHAPAPKWFLRAGRASLRHCR